MILKRKLYLLAIIWCCLTSKHMTLQAREAAFVTKSNYRKIGDNVFAQLLRDMRTRLGLKQIDMAEKLNMDVSLYVATETGRLLPSKAKTVQKFIDVLDKPADEVRELLRVGRTERRAQILLDLLAANDITEARLMHHFSEQDSYSTLIRKALLRKGLTFRQLKQQTGIDKLSYASLPPVYSDQLELLGSTLHIDYQLLHEAAMIEFFLRRYIVEQRHYGKLPLPASLSQLLEQGLIHNKQILKETSPASEATFVTALRYAMREQGYTNKQLSVAASLPLSKLNAWLKCGSSPSCHDIQKLVDALHPEAEAETLQHIADTWQGLVDAGKARNSLSYSLRQLNLTWDDVIAYDISPTTLIAAELKRLDIKVLKLERMLGLGKTTLYSYLRGRRELVQDSLGLIHRELALDYNLDRLRQLAKIEKLAWVYQRNVKKYGEFLPEGEQQDALKNVLRIRTEAINMYLAIERGINKLGIERGNE